MSGCGPRSARARTTASRDADKRADENHRNPQDDEAEEKCSDGNCALPGVVAGVSGWYLCKE